MKNYFFSFALLIGLSANAEDNLLKFRKDNPDMVLQMKVNESNRQYLFNQIKESVRLFYDIDLLNEEIDLPLIELNDGLVLEDFLDRRLAAILKKSLRFSLNQVSTNLDVYKLNYKLGQPIFKLKTSVSQDQFIDVILDFKIHSLDIDVENILITNSSPGVSLSPQYENNGRIRLKGKEHMTLVDDVYLKLVSPKDKPILSIQSDANQPAVASGSIKLRIYKNNDSSLHLEYKGHDFNFFEANDAEILANNIRVFLAEGSKIGGIDGIEFGRRELKIKTDIKDLVNKKRVFIMNMIKSPIAEAIKTSDIAKMIEDEINNVRIKGSINYSFKNNQKLNGMQISSQINSVGFIDADVDSSQQLHLSTNNSVTWLNNLFQTPEVLPFPFSNSSLHQMSLDKITNDIRNGNTDLIISLGQDYINHLILNVTKGIIPIPNDPNTKKDDLIKSGKKGVFYILDGNSNSQGKIVMDILVKPNFFQSFGMAVATFRTKLYFPLIIIPEISLEMKNNTPSLVFKVKDIDMSEDTLRQGLHGVGTNLNKGISRKLVIHKIKQQLTPFIGSVIHTLSLTQLEGLNIGKIVKLSSDGMGRLNLNINLSEVDEDTREIARELPKLIHEFVAKK
jgi:hypothetical protein